MATECTIHHIPDGDILFYQEDVIDDESQAHIILEGSLCGYFNKAFGQHSSKRDKFQSLKSKASIDIGDLHATYGKGAICGLDDLYSSLSCASKHGNQPQLKSFCRRRSVHSQEATVTIAIAKDTLDRVSERFGLTYEKGVLSSSKEARRRDVTHSELFSLLSDTAKRALLQNALSRRLEIGEIVFGAEADSSTTAFAVVCNGHLDIHCMEREDTQSATASSFPTTTATTSVYDNAANSHESMARSKQHLASLSRGQTFGNCMIALGHSNVWSTNCRSHRLANLRFEVTAGNSSTEILWITREQYEQFVIEDHLRLSYSPILGTSYAASSTTNVANAIKHGKNVADITRQLLTDATLSKFFYQFPFLVHERFCHDMEVQHFQASGLFLEAGGAIDRVFVVVAGALHSQKVQKDQSAAKKALVRQQGVSLEQEDHFVPGDAFGACELLKRCSISEASVLVDAGTMLLGISRSAFERWASPRRRSIITRTGSVLQSLVNSTLSPLPNPQHTFTNKCVISEKVKRRQSGPIASLTAATEEDCEKSCRFDEVATLLKQFGMFASVPQFLLTQMLRHTTLVRKAAGTELFHEGDNQQVLVVILSGFVSFYSCGNPSATIDMFQNHPFCVYSTFSGSTINPEEFVDKSRAHDTIGLSPPAILKHRAAMYGVHVQTLPPRNAFRTGVLQEGTVCPATVLAQTDCEYFLLDQHAYAQLLVEHVPAVDMSKYNLDSISSKTSSDSQQKPLPQDAPNPRTRHGTIPSSLLSYLNAAPLSWLPSSPAKKLLLLRSMQHVQLAPGQRFIRFNDKMEQIVLVLSGKLAVYVRANHKATSVFNASQRSIQSVALEQNVASNYSTTSQQLYQEQDHSTYRKAFQRQIAQILEMKTIDDHSKSKLESKTQFPDLVLHVVKEAKSRQSRDSKTSLQVPHAPSTPPVARRSLHSMVTKMKAKSKSEEQSMGNSPRGAKELGQALFMCHMAPGDVYGEELLDSDGTFQSAHDIYADAAIPLAKGRGLNVKHMALAGTELLCLDRHILHAILAKTEEDAANELHAKSMNAKAKWKLAGKNLFKQTSHSTTGELEEYSNRKKTPKLFNFLNSVLDQRRSLTMTFIAQLPLLRDLTNDARRELCVSARFEALDRYADAYKGYVNGQETCHRFFLLLSGRIRLVANGPSSPLSQSTASSPTRENTLREVTTGGGFGEFGILVPEAPACIAAVAAEHTKLLSIPAEMFMKHWPCIAETRANIDYLRTKIPSFASLDLERLTYLYHSFSIQSFVRGSSIFQFHDSKPGSLAAKEVYLIKEGTCCIRQFITLNGLSEGDSGGDERNIRRHNDVLSSQTKKPMKRMKVLVTVADVSAGHVFWMDAHHFPITLVAVSAAVTIASISIDSLKAIVPRSSLNGLEDLGKQLCTLYQQQLQLAKRATIAVINKKLNLQNQQSTPNQRLPALEPRMLGNDGFAAREVQLWETNDSSISTTRENNCTTLVNATYAAQHQIERYVIANELLAFTLVGSFQDKKKARRTANVSEEEHVTMLSACCSKQDECSKPELTTKAFEIVQAEASRLQIDDKATDNSAKLSKGRKDRNMAIARLEMTRIIDDDKALYEIDVRARVHEHMKMVGSPIRAIRLEPSRTLVNSLGKYYAECPSPFAELDGLSRQQQLQLEVLSPTSKFPIRPVNDKSAKIRTPCFKLLQANRASDSASYAALTRKQGFLTSLRVKNAFHYDDDKRGVLGTILPRIHRGRRFFYALVDSELREYADTVSLNNVVQTSCLRRYDLNNTRQVSSVHDVSVLPGKAAALLRQSFLLIIDDEVQYFFTASSAIEKQKWMTELNQALVLGELQNMISVKQSPRPVISVTPSTDAAAVVDAFEGRRRIPFKEQRLSSVFVPEPKPDDALQVDYRIS